jgi:hypothetical protein
MKSAEKIIESLLNRIAMLYAAPQQQAWTMCGLDGLLYQLHWLHADATDRLDEFVAARMALFKSDLTDWRQVHASAEFHAIVEQRHEFEPIISEWRKLDEMLGIRLEFPPAGDDPAGAK